MLRLSVYHLIELLKRPALWLTVLVSLFWAMTCVLQPVAAAESSAKTGQSVYLTHPADLSVFQKSGLSEMAIVVLFSVPDCAYCEEIRTHTLRHLEGDPRYKGRIRVFEIKQQSSAVDTVWFDGVQRSGEKLSRLLGVRFSPTVMVFDEKGVVAGKPLLGASLPDFYASYVDELIRSAWKLP